jgi:hypothetical protein
VWFVPPRLFACCGLAWGKARLGAPGLGGLRKAAVLSILRLFNIGAIGRFQRRFVYKSSFSAAC